MLSRFLGAGDERTVVAGAAFFAATSALVGVRGLVQGAGLFRTLGISNLVEGAGRTALAVELFHRHVSVNQALVSIGVVIGAVTALTICMLVRRVGVTVENADFRRVFVQKNSSQLFITLGSIAVLTFLDTIVSRHFLTAYQSGLYNAAALAGRAVMTVLAFAPAVIVPKLVGATARDESTVTIVRQTATLLIVICAPAVALFFLVPELVIRIIAGAGFQQATPLVGRYGLAAAALAAGTIVCSMRIGRGDFRMTPFVLATTASEAIAFMFFHANSEALVAVVVFGHSATLLATLLPATGSLSDRSANVRSEYGKARVVMARKRTR